jgi:TonB family protein
VGQTQEEPPKVPPRVIREPGGPGKGFPHTEDFYPANALRLGQEGVATVQVCVDEKGRLTSMPTITQSSGMASLDDGAVKLAKAGSGHYRPTTEDGRPVSSCYGYRIGFHVKEGR